MGLRGLPNLIYLDISFNQIARLDDANQIRKHLTALQELNLAGNPLTEIKGYRNFILRRLTQLKTMEGISIKEEEKVQCCLLIKLMASRLKLNKNPQLYQPK